MVGRFAAQKNPEFLLECFAEYNKLNKESVLLWIGDGELQEKIQDRAKNMGLKGACLFVGRKNNIENGIPQWICFCCRQNLKEWVLSF